MECLGNDWKTHGEHKFFGGYLGMLSPSTLQVEAVSSMWTTPHKDGSKVCRPDERSGVHWNFHTGVAEDELLGGEDMGEGMRGFHKPRHDPSGTAIGLPINWGGNRHIYVAVPWSVWERLGSWFCVCFWMFRSGSCRGELPFQDLLHRHTQHALEIPQELWAACTLYPLSNCNTTNGFH